MKKKHLVTTSLEVTWQRKTDLVFLGEWCLLAGERNPLLSKNNQVLNYPWDDEELRSRDFRYLKELYEDVLPILTASLNRYHGLTYSTDYWRILIGPWLIVFLPLMLEFWRSIELATRQFIELTSTIAKFDEASLIPNSMDEFNNIYSSSQWTHLIYSYIIERHTNIEKSYISPINFYHTRESSNVKKSIVKKIIKTISKRLARKANFLIIGSYLPKYKEFILSFKLGQFPQVWEYINPTNVPADMNSRNYLLDISSNDQFLNFLSFVIPRQLPKCYFEGYKILCDDVHNFNFPEKIKCIFTSNSHASNEFFKIIAASHRESGKPLVISQHGGNYGIAKDYMLEDHEIAISSKYLTWGWSDLNNPNVLPCGFIKDYKRFSLGNNVGKCLLVQNCVPLHTYGVVSGIQSSQWLNYLENQFEFVEGLSEFVKNDLSLRIYPYGDYGWNQKERWIKRYPEISFAKYDLPISKALIHSRICVVSYNGTVFLETLAMNMPTIIFWDLRYYEIRENARIYFDALARVGIFHKNPRSAASFINCIWGDVGSWWYSEQVQKVVANFKENFVKVNNEIPRDLAYILNNLVNTKD
jgi:putative transferase (TIGR04331 family)